MATPMRVSTADLLKEYQIGHLFPDFPPNFVPPWLLDPNYVAPNMQLPMYVIIGITTFFMSITVIARLIVRSPLKKSSWGVDDWLIIPAWLTTLGMAAGEIYSIHVGGVGYHSYDLTWDQLCSNYRSAFIIFMFYIWSTLFTKLSIIAFYYRLAGPMNSRTYRFLTPLVVWCVALTTTSMFLNIFGYKPIQAGWDLNYKLEPFTALPAHKLWVALSAVYTVTDVVILLIPLPMLWKLRMSFGKKIRLCLLFSLGGVACVAIAVRTIYIHRVYDSFDPTYGGYILTIADQLECTIAIIAASIPALGALLVTAWNGGLGAVISWWQSANYYISTSKSQSHQTASDGTELRSTKNWKGAKQLSGDSSDTDTLALPMQHNSTYRSTNSKPGRWKSWANHNVLNFSTRDDSQMQSTLDGTVIEEDGLPLRAFENSGKHPKGPNFAEQSFDLVIQNNDTYRDPWDDDVEKAYLPKH